MVSAISLQEVFASCNEIHRAVYPPPTTLAAVMGTVGPGRSPKTTPGP